MDKSRNRLIRILAVVGIGLLACGVKLWFDMEAPPSVIYNNSDESSGDDIARDAVSDETGLTVSTGLLPDSTLLITPGDPQQGSAAVSPTPVPTPENIPVYLCGSISSPGIYKILPGTYLYELIDIAGGLLPDAASEYINLVFQLTGPVSIYIPSSEEMKAFLDGTGNSSSEYLRSGLVQGIWGSDPSGNVTAGTGAESQDIVLININTADQRALETLPGVGETTALAIISFREKSGGFTVIEDIMKVAGIKEGRFEAIREYITV